MPFTGNGTVSLMTPMGSTTCNVTVSGSTSQPAQITSATFTGDPACASLHAVNFPWKYSAHSMTRATLSHVTLFYKGYGRCGPNQVNTTVNNGAISIMDHLPSAGGICSINATINTTPSLSITSMP